MALFTDEAAVYGALGKLFSDVIADEKTQGVLLRTNTIVQLQLRDPRATVTVAVRQGQDPLIYFGPTTRRPEVFLQTDADTAHGWLLGEMDRAGHQYGLVTLCIGGGQGIALLLERAT